MMKKVLYGVALTLFAGVSVGSLQSCKDDLNDITTQTSYDLKQLQAAVKARMDDLQRQITENREDIDNLYLKLNEYATLKYVNNLIYGADEANGQIGEGGLLGMINGALGRIDNIEDILGIPDGYLMEDGVTKGNVIDYLKGKMAAQQQSIQEILNFLGYGDDLTAQEKTLKETLDELQTQLDELQEQLDELTNEEGTGRVDVLETKVSGIETQINDIISQLDAINNRINKLITGLIIQRAFGPAFGDFSLPIGVQSNMLFNWYGENISNLDKFPTADPDEAAALGVNFAGFTTIPVDYNEVNLGDLYLTINPINHEYNGAQFTLITSDGTALDSEKYKLVVKASSDKLMFGSRASEAITSPLYKANLTVNQADIDPIKITLDKEVLKTVVKNAAKDPSLLTASKLVKAVYDQINLNAPASYAVRYDWSAPTLKDKVDENGVVVTDEAGNVVKEQVDQNYAVISNFDLAVATARPLSYNALKDYSSSKQLPTGHLTNFIEKLKEKALDKINVNATTKVGDYTVKIGSISFANANASDADQTPYIKATVKDMTVNGTPVYGPMFLSGVNFGATKGTFTVDCMDVETAVETVNKAIVEVVCYAADQMDNDAFRAEAQLKLDAVLLEMNNQINDIVAQIRGNIGSAFDSIENSNYFALANRAFNFYNRVASKINNFLSNPNAYLQVAAFYETSDDLGILSQVASQPTPFSGNGKAINIYLSSYTGEFLAPAYKKFFACTSDPNVNAGSNVLGKVVDGNVTEVSIPVEKLEKNKVYEFVYQGLDYSGYTSTKKFYIEVK